MLQRVPKPERIVYVVRSDDVVIVAVAKRGDDEVYQHTKRALSAGLPPKPPPMTLSNTVPPGKAPANGSQRPKKPRTPRKRGRGKRRH